MTFSNINISSPNDGLGDKLRTAFGIVNYNFTEFYKEVGVLESDINTLGATVSINTNNIQTINSSLSTINTSLNTKATLTQLNSAVVSLNNAIIDLEEQLASAIRGFGNWTPIFNGGTVYGENSNTFYKATGNDNVFDSEVYSLEGYSRGCYVSAQAQSTVNYILFGLSETPALTPSFEAINFAWYVTENGGLEIYESGNLVISVGTYTTNTVLQITYDGTNIRYWKDGTLIRTFARVIGNALYFDSTFFRTIVWNGNIPNGLKNVIFGPM